jgi:hypothetical protein
MKAKYEDFEKLAKDRIPTGCYFIDPRKPERTAAQFLDWLRDAPIVRGPALTRGVIRERIFEFLDTAAWWKTSIPGPERGVRDHLILPFCPSTRDVNRVAEALRQAL